MISHWGRYSAGDDLSRMTPEMQIVLLESRWMPTILRSGPYRFFFYSHEPNEPSHVHVERDEMSAKFWLDPVLLARNFGFSPPELNKVESLVNENQKLLLEAWDGFFGSGRR